MPAEQPTILATSGGMQRGPRGLRFSGLTEYAVELARVSGRPARVCVIATAGGDDRGYLADLYGAAAAAGYQASHLAVFQMPNVPDPAAHLLAQDVIFVGGGSVAGMVAMWRLHGIDRALHQAWRSGVVLTGVSAGSICWHVGGTTDSFGPSLRAYTDGLGFLPYANGVHYDSEEQRRPLFQRLIAEGTLPDGYATEEGVGLLYRDTELVEAVTERPGRTAYAVRRLDGRAVETPLPTRELAPTG